MPDPVVQERITAVAACLRYSAPYVEHLHDRVGATPYLDRLHGTIKDLLGELQRRGYRTTT